MIRLLITYTKCTTKNALFEFATFFKCLIFGMGHMSNIVFYYQIGEVVE